MPEGDTLNRLAIALQPLVGSAVVEDEYRWPSVAGSTLVGQRLESVRSWAKYLLMDFGPEHVLLTHLRMEGSWQLTSTPLEPWQKKDARIRALITLEAPDGAGRRQLIGRRLGAMSLTTRAGASVQLGHLGPDPLDTTREFDQALAEQRLTAEYGDVTDSSIAAALLDQRRMAGVGNIIRAEALFLSKIHPLASLEEVRESGKTNQLVALARDILRLNSDRERRTTPVTWPAIYWVYGRGGKLCHVCGARIVEFGLDGANARRVCFYCPSCQPVPEGRERLARTPSPVGLRMAGQGPSGAGSSASGARETSAKRYSRYER